MRYDQNMHKEIEAINDMVTALQTKIKNFHAVWGELNKCSSDYCDTTNLDLFANDLDGYKADEVEPILEQVRDAYEREHAEIDTMEEDESSMLRYYQAGIRP